MSVTRIKKQKPVKEQVSVAEWAKRIIPIKNTPMHVMIVPRVVRRLTDAQKK